MQQAMLWIGFVVLILGMLLLDILLLQKKKQEIGIRESLLWTLIWILVSLAFNFAVYFYLGFDSALEFLTGYLIEKSLSVDNIFVFIIIFSYFDVPLKYQHKILFWGILGAVIMRAVFIFAGVAVIQQFHWVIYILGAFLVYIGIRMALQKNKDIRPEKNPVLRAFNRFFPVDTAYRGGKFFIKKAGKIAATPLLVALIVIETTDIVFAVDSIPAILSITLNPFIVFTSNMFAILGLRALFFTVSGIMRLFFYLNYGLSVILVFVGIKMLIADLYKIPVSIALAAVGGILCISIILSLLIPPKKQR